VVQPPKIEGGVNLNLQVNNNEFSLFKSLNDKKINIDDSDDSNK
jgi:hypothetical protein